MQNSNWAVALGFVIACAACGKGELKVDSSNNGRDDGGQTVFDAGRDDGGFTPMPDGSMPSDMRTASDMSTDNTDGGGSTDAASCADVACGFGATCVGGMCQCDDGLVGDPMVGCSLENPCADVDCPAGASCNPDGSCSCDPFFDDDGAGGCDPQPPAADLAARTRTDVCDLWTSTYQRASDEFWMLEPVDDCDPGVLHTEEQREALHRASVFRQLVGLYPVSTANDRLGPNQECATMHAATGMGLNHEPPMTWECYTQAGAGAAGSSNLALGVRNPAGTVALYVGDSGVRSLGHRRWVFNPGMARTAFGHRGSYGCMYSFDGGRSHNPEFVAYPAPGFFPRDAVLGYWSVSGGASYSDDHTVTITNLSDDSDVPVSDVYSPVFGFLPSTLAWSVDTRNLALDTDYQVTIADAQGTTVLEYTTTLIGCP
jgi:hypothetical protein